MNALRPQGPNVKQLIAMHASVLAIPNGTVDPIAAGLDAIADPVKLKAHLLEARERIFSAIDMIKRAPDNQWGDDDEAIAGEILRRTRERLRR